MITWARCSWLIEQGARKQLTSKTGTLKAFVSFNLIILSTCNKLLAKNRHLSLPTNKRPMKIWLTGIFLFFIVT